jgi:hypothetical protein
MGISRIRSKNSRSTHYHGPRSYAHEAEMRAFVWDIPALSSQKYLHPEELPAGLAFSIDPQELISEVWVGPREKSWIPPIVEKIVARYSLNIPVKISNKLMNRRLIQSRPNLDTLALAAATMAMNTPGDRNTMLNYVRIVLSFESFISIRPERSFAVRS